jgi:hypothetical protein
MVYENIKSEQIEPGLLWCINPSISEAKVLLLFTIERSRPQDANEVNGSGTEGKSS